MKILAITRYIGDSRRQNLLKYLSKKAEVSVFHLALTKRKYFINLIKTFSFNRTLWRERSKKNEYFFKEMSKAIEKEIAQNKVCKYDIILLFEGLYSPGLEDTLCKPYIIYEDTTSKIVRKYWPPWVPDTMQTNAYELLEKKMYLNAAKIFTATQWTGTSLIKEYSVNPLNIEVVGLGCNFNYPLQTKDKNLKQILFVGYDFELKGGNVLLEAFNEVKKVVYDAQLLIVGANPNFKHKQPGVSIIGKVKDRNKLMELFQTSLAIVIPSYFDAMPTVAVEAMGGKTALVVSDRCGIAEYLVDGESGFVVPSGNIETLADRLIKLLLDPNLALKMGNAGFQIVQNKLRWEIIADKMSAVLHKDFI